MPPQGTVLVEDREARRTLRDLGMSCNEKEIPSLIGTPRGGERWLLMAASFVGQAGMAEADGELTRHVELQGTAAVAIGDRRIAGILSPGHPTDPALWWSWTLAALKVSSAGAQGLLRKRPVDITVQSEAGVLRVREVARVYGSGRFHLGEEQSFLRAMGR